MGTRPALPGRVGGLAAGRPNASPAVLVAHYRDQVRYNREAPIRVDAWLRQRSGIERTPVRVMDAIPWTSHPASSLARFDNGREHHFFRGTPF